MDLFYWGGPVTPKQASDVIWERPTEILSFGRDGSSANATLYNEFAQADGFAWAQMARKAGIDPNQLGNLGIGGFSAFHGLANKMLTNDKDRARTRYVHLADACFQGRLAEGTKQGFVEFGKLAATQSDKLMVVTTNGPWNDNIYYCWDGTCYDLTSGALCFQKVWEQIMAELGLGASDVRVPAAPPGVPAPTRAMALGNLLWFHYEPQSHAFHVHDIATPYIQHFGAPFMAGQQYPGQPSRFAKYAAPVFVAGALATAAAVWWARRRSTQ